MGYVSSTLGSDILTEGEDEEGDSEGYELSRQLCGIDYSPGRSLETVEGAITGEQNYWITHLNSHIGKPQSSKKLH